MSFDLTSGFRRCKILPSAKYLTAHSAERHDQRSLPLGPKIACAYSLFPYMKTSHLIMPL